MRPSLERWHSWTCRVSLGSVCLAASVIACSPSAPAQARVVVTTDAETPLLVARVRFDVYESSGAWIATRDVAARSSASWPISFAVASGSGSSVWLRIRGYPDGAVRDYLGERYVQIPKADSPLTERVTIEAGDLTPRLVIDGSDRTPAMEPDPFLTIDRLVLLETGSAETVHLKLSRRCQGMMADLRNHLGCVNDPQALVEQRVAPGYRDDPADVRASAPVATSLVARAETPGLFDAEIALSGGTFILGEDVYVAAGASGIGDRTSPRKVVQVSPFVIDQHEVTVARMRAALRRGFALRNFLGSNEGTLARSSGESDKTRNCTFSQAPRPAGEDREAYPLNCVSYEGAAAFCRFHGGRLPTEAEFEFASSISGRTAKTKYAWGNEPPPCDGVVYARSDDVGIIGDDTCFRAGRRFGPAPISESEGDVTPTQVMELAGSLSEWSFDDPAGFDTACWLHAPANDPACTLPASAERRLRGGNWASNGGFETFSALRLRVPHGGSNSQIGFRCVRSEAKP